MRLATIILFCLSIFGQTSNSLRVDYDRFKDNTEVSIPLQQLRGTRLNGLAFAVFAMHKGQTPAKPEAVELCFQSVNREPLFMHDRELNFIFDLNKRAPFGELRMTHRKVLDNGSWLEAMCGPTDLEFVRRIQVSLSAAGQIGTTEFLIPQETKDLLKEFLLYFEPKK